jgi:hypothetical protein
VNHLLVTVPPCEPPPEEEAPELLAPAPELLVVATELDPVVVPVVVPVEPPASPVARAALDPATESGAGIVVSLVPPPDEGTFETDAASAASALGPEKCWANGSFELSDSSRSR